MIVVATYDISADSRRSRVAALLQGWGDRVQRSVYVLDITAETYVGQADPPGRVLFWAAL